MKFQNRLQLLGVPLIILPLLATVGLYGIMMSGAISKTEKDLLLTKLSLLEYRVSSSWDVLTKVGLQNDPYFVANARESIARNFRAVLSSGEEFLIFSASGEYLAGSLDPAGRQLSATDPLRTLLLTPPGTKRVASDFFGPARHSQLVAFRAFPSWKWILAISADEKIAFGAFRAAAALSIGLSVIFVTLGALAFFLIADRVSRPLSRLTALARALGEGRFEVVGEIGSAAFAGGGDEIQVLGREFEAMGLRLASLTRGLEARVAERTWELEKSNAELTGAIAELRATQDQLIAAEKMASLGQLVAGIAHELNTPIGAISSAGRSLVELMTGQFLDIMDLYRGLSGKDAALFQSLVATAFSPRLARDSVEERRLRWALESELEGRGFADAAGLAEKLVELGAEDLVTGRGPGKETLADFGQGAAVVDATWQLFGMGRSVRIVELASEKAAKVVRSLKIYSHQEDGEEARAVDLRQELETILTIYHSALKRGVEVVRSYESVPEIACRRDRLSQVWINLIDNALHAMSFSGRLEVAIRGEDGRVAVSVTDSGTGIPEELRPRIFSPFFTTKASGSGTGLGLSIAKRIVEESGGSIGFESRPGRTTFTVRLPCASCAGQEVHPIGAADATEGGI